MKATFIHRKTCLNEGKEMRKSKKVKRRFLKVQGEFQERKREVRRKGAGKKNTVRKKGRKLTDKQYREMDKNITHATQGKAQHTYGRQYGCTKENRRA